MNKSKGPDFVCIGAQKSGTTWLYENLNNHPDVWMPPVKEIHYFNRLCLNEELLGDWGMPHPDGIKRYTEAIKRIDLNNLRWLMRYYEYGMTHRWYAQLFDHRYTNGKVSGDITPAYSTLDERGVRYAYEVLGGDMPIILILRNPIERSWSAAKMMLRYLHKSPDDVSLEVLNDILDKPVIRLGSEYSRIIQLWKKYFNNLHILSFDELCESPESLLGKVSSILKIRDRWEKATIRKRVWADEKKSPIPPNILHTLVEHYASEIGILASMPECVFAQSWYEEMIKRK